MFKLRQLQGTQDLAAVQAVAAACADAGELESSAAAYDWLDLSRADPEDWLFAEVGGQVVAYGYTTIDWQEKDGTWVYLHLGRVHPTFRRRGIGTALLNSLEERCHVKAREAGRSHTAELAANASELERDAAAFLRRRGYFVAFTMLDMSMRLDGELPVVPALPVGYQLRPLLPEHHLAVWQSISGAYDARDLNHPRFGEVPRDEDYDRYFSQDPALIFVAWRGKVVAGQVIARIVEDGGAELLEVSVGMGHQRRGLARTLMLYALHELQRRGVRDVRLSTRQENPSQAWRQYEKLGFEVMRRFPRWRKARTEGGAYQ